MTDLFPIFVLLVTSLVVLVPHHSDAKHVAICEEEKGVISCDEETTVQILHSNYGRTDQTTCATKKNGQRHREKEVRRTDCRGDGSMEKLKMECNDKRSCDVVASNRLFGDPCKGTCKYLSVIYGCKPAKTYICENDTDTISCSEGMKISIVFSMFGRTGPKRCGNREDGQPLSDKVLANIECQGEAKSKDVLSERCNGKSSCRIRADTKSFGDPCPGTAKYLRLGFLCI